MSMLDRPISEFDGPVDSVRIPVRAADRRVQAVPGSADRARRPPQVAGVRAAGRHAQVPRLPRLHRQLRDRAGLGHRLPRRLARQGRREVHARRAQPAAVGDVREEQLRLPLQAAAVLPVHAQLEQGLPRVVAAHAHPALRRADPDPPLFRSAAEVPPRGAGQGHVAQAAGASAGSASRPTSIRCRSTTSRSRRSNRDLAQVPAQRGHAAADGDVPLVGLAERVAAPDPRAQPPVRQSAGRARRGHRGRRLDVGRVAVGQGALPVQLLRGGRARHGLDVERDRQGARRLAPRAGRQRIAARLPAQPPDLRGAARRARRATDLELGPGHRAGGVVRRARADLHGRRRTSRKATCAAVRDRCRRRRARRRRRAWQAFFAGRSARQPTESQ